MLHIVKSKKNWSSPGLKKMKCLLLIYSYFAWNIAFLRCTIRVSPFCFMHFWTMHATVIKQGKYHPVFFSIRMHLSAFSIIHGTKLNKYVTLSRFFWNCQMVYFFLCRIVHFIRFSPQKRKNDIEARIDTRIKNFLESNSNWAV